MKIAYFDCFSGCSGDMLLGAFIDAGLDIKVLKKALSSLDIGKYKLTAEKVRRSSITATKFNVVINDTTPHHRSLKDILNIIDTGRLPDNVKEKSTAVFRTLGEAEAKIHGVNINTVEFHELGAIDTIIDIVGTIFALDYLGIERVYASPLPAGTGYISGSHGILPVPAPATIQLLTAAKVPLISFPEKPGSSAGELVTPTGAALVTSLAEFIRPDMTVEKVGYGAGKKDFPAWPNIMRIWLADVLSDDSSEKMVLLETNIDDMNPQIYGYLMEKLLSENAADVWFTPIQMKKNRPAIMLSVLAPTYAEATLTEIILKETTTLGVRSQPVSRHTARRELIEFESSLGKVHVKIKRLSGNISHISPEYDDCQIIAIKRHLPLQEVLHTVQKEAGQKYT